LSDEIIVAHTEEEEIAIGTIVGRRHWDECKRLPLLIQETVVLSATVVEVEAVELGVYIVVWLSRQWKVL